MVMIAWTSRQKVRLLGVAVTGWDVKFGMGSSKLWFYNFVVGSTTAEIMEVDLYHFKYIKFFEVLIFKMLFSSSSGLIE